MLNHRAALAAAVLMAAWRIFPAHGAIVWSSGPNDLTFTKAAGADPTLAQNQDPINADVALTRGNSMGLYNAVTELGFTHGVSPAGTEWAFSGINENPTFAYGAGAAEFSSLTFAPWETSLGGTVLLQGNITSAAGVLHLISANIYIDIEFLSWGGMASGGEFSYVRAVAPVPSPTLATWNGASGNWSDPTAWSSNPSFPNNGTPSGASYNVAINAGIVNLDVSPVIGTLTLSGGTLTGNGNFTVAGGTVGGIYNVTGTTTLSSGTLVLGAGVHTTGAFAGPGNLTVGAGAALTSKGITVGQLVVNGAASLQPALGNAGTSKVNSLIVANAAGTYTGKLNLNDADLILQATDSGDKATKIAQLDAAVTADAHGGLWTGNGITSATAAADAAHLGVGVFDNAVLGKTDFGGTGNVDANSILVAVTHLGDANRNGIVDIQDLTIVANNWQKSQNNWAQGDLNRDGIVDIQDFTIVANNWQQSSNFSLQDGTPSLSPNPLPLTPSPVPEPATLPLLALAALLFRKKRR